MSVYQVVLGQYLQCLHIVIHCIFDCVFFSYNFCIGGITSPTETTDVKRTNCVKFIAIYLSCIVCGYHRVLQKLFVKKKLFMKSWKLVQFLKCNASYWMHFFPYNSRTPIRTCLLNIYQYMRIKVPKSIHSNMVSSFSSEIYNMYMYVKFYCSCNTLIWSNLWIISKK